MISYRLATRGDIDEAFVNKKECFGQEQEVLEGMYATLERGRVYTLFDSDGNIGGVVGFVLLWPGVASCTAITTDHLDKHPIGYTRLLHALIGADMAHYSVHRSEMAVLSSFTKGHRWAKALGFSWEGTLRKYSSSQHNYEMYGRVS